jgi:two-component system, cell cycle sensor histidine kinase and response regulator CckA
MTDSLRLFLIEDNDENALLIRKSLERAAHQVTRCRNAADALIVLGQSIFDLVILDQELPDMNGLDLLETLAREGITVPVLMVTGRGDEKLAARVLRAGALDYVVKDSALVYLVELPKRVVESVTRYRLERSNDLLVQALESARDGIMITDLQGTIQKVNQALINMTGYTRQELVGQTPRLLASRVHSREVFANMWRTILGRHSWQGELTNRRKDGSLFQTSITISPILDQHRRLTHFVGIERDITEHKQLERQLLQAQKMQSVGTLAGGVAHEFNNLLAGINGYASLGLREANLSPTLREFLQQVVALSERAAQLTRQLLAFARKPALTRMRTVIPDLLQSTADLVRRTLHQDVVLEMETQTADGTPLLVEADANQLQQALVNLALNARDAIRERVTRQIRPTETAGGGGSATGGWRTTGGAARGGWRATREEGKADKEKADASVPASRPAPLPPLPTPADTGIAFRVRHVVLAVDRPGFPQNVPPGDYVVVEVEDHGAGMTAEVLNQSLDPFFTTKDVGQGTGLGLPMVFGIVQGHQGCLTIDSAPAKGTSIALYLPRLVDGPETAEGGALYPSAEVLEPENVPSRAIVVIDDEEAVLDVVRRFLQIAGHEVFCVTSCQDALDLIGAGNAVDLVILDLMMPREDAATSFQRLRQRRADVPILLCTGLPQAEPAPELLRCPGVGLIRKPFRMTELWYVVKQMLMPSPQGEGD